MAARSHSRPECSCSPSSWRSPPASSGVSPARSPPARARRRPAARSRSRWAGPPSPTTSTHSSASSSRSYELFHVSYDFLTDYGDQYLETAAGARRELDHERRRPHLDVQDPPGGHVERRPAAHGQDVAFSYTYQKQLDLTAFLSALDGIKSVTAPDDTTVVIQCEPAQGRHPLDVGARSCRSTSGASSRPTTRPPSTSTARRSSGRVRSRSSSGRRASSSAPWPTRTTGAASPRSTRSSSRSTRTRTRWRRTSSSGPSTSPSTSRRRRSRRCRATPALASEACSQKAFDYLSFNCYTGPSLGNPVLRDVKFRQALNWAVDKDKLTTLAYQTYADPATSIFEVNFYDPNLDWHWEPPADVKYTFDLTKAKQALADAGYKDTDGDGILNDPKNGDKDIKLRLWSRTESAQSQVMGKLITGWWKDLGLDIQYSVEDNGTLIDGGYNYARRHVQARLRHLHLGVAAQRVGPGPASRLLPHRADREPERRLLVEQGVRRPVAPAVEGARPAEAQSRSPTRCRRSCTSSLRTSS